jgi:uracil-DNA glycosylase family 4
MARLLSAEAAAALRGHIGFLRELGVYELYRRGDVGAVSEAIELVPAAATALSHEEMPPPQAAPAPPQAVPKAELAPAQVAPAQAALLDLEEETEIARKHPQPLTPPVDFPAAALAPGERASALEAVRAEIGDCTRCPLAFAGRHTIVFGDGDPNARILFVGEGPGADEDMQGIPFIGKAGQLLNNMITAMGLKREEVYIANIVKCRPPGNRVPEPVEANTCTPFLFEQIGIVRPEIIVALGSTAATYLMGGKASLSSLRGRVHAAFGTKLIVTYHPAYLLRDPRQKKEAWADLQIAMRELAGE